MEELAKAVNDVNLPQEIQKGGYDMRRIMAESSSLPLGDSQLQNVDESPEFTVK